MNTLTFGELEEVLW